MAASSQESLEILESALDQAFSAPPRPAPKEVAQQTTAAVTQESVENPLTESVQEVVLSDSVASDDSWKAEYESQVQSWRIRSAEERERAEKERLRWEGIRATEKEEAAKRKATGIVDDVPEPSLAQHEEDNWERVKASTESSNAESISSIPEDVPPAVKVELQEVPSISAVGLPRTHSHQDTLTDESQKWEDVPSVTSSFPSLSFPEHTETPSPPPPQQLNTQPMIVTASQAIFDSSLSTRTRITAVFASLSVNLFLPFINGVMLGFGEIFANDFVMQWLGWRRSTGPASSVANVGIQLSPREQRQKRSMW